MKVYVIRHGESEANKALKWAGWQDVHITDRGRDDARKARDVIKNVCFEKVYSSDLARAVETAQIVIPGCNPETSGLLREMNVGTLTGKLLNTVSDIERKSIDEKGFTDYGGESNDELDNRIRMFMKQLESLQYENVAVFSHRGWMRKMLNIAIEANLQRGKIVCNNCAIAIFEYTDFQWRLNSWINVT